MKAKTTSATRYRII